MKAKREIPQSFFFPVSKMRGKKKLRTENVLKKMNTHNERVPVCTKYALLRINWNVVKVFASVFLFLYLEIGMRNRTGK